MKDGCAFCNYAGPSPILGEASVALFDGIYGTVDRYVPYFVIEPLEPVTPGHRLVIPRQHTSDFRTDPRLLGAMMQAAADLAAGYVESRREVLARNGESRTEFVPGCNLIVSAGAEATQTVMHMHVHVVPRREGDGLMLPWSEMVTADEDEEAGTFTYFLPDGMLKVESGDVVTAFIRAREAVDRHATLLEKIGGEGGEESSHAFRDAMLALERAVYPERRTGPGDTWVH